MKTLALEFKNTLLENGIKSTIATAKTGTIYVHTDFGSVRISDHLANSMKSNAKYELSCFDSIETVLGKMLQEKNNVNIFRNMFNVGDIVTNGFVDFEVLEKTNKGLILKNLYSGNTKEESNPSSHKVFTLKK